MGLVPRLLRVPPACALMITTFEFGKNIFLAHNARLAYALPGPGSGPEAGSGSVPEPEPGTGTGAPWPATEPVSLDSTHAPQLDVPQQQTHGS